MRDRVSGIGDRVSGEEVRSESHNGSTGIQPVRKLAFCLFAAYAPW